jgi:hypothetical protein
VPVLLLLLLLVLHTSSKLSIGAALFQAPLRQKGKPLAAGDVRISVHSVRYILTSSPLVVGGAVRCSGDAGIK